MRKELDRKRQQCDENCFGHKVETLSHTSFHDEKIFRIFATEWTLKMPVRHIKVAHLMIYSREQVFNHVKEISDMQANETRIKKCHRGLIES